MGAAVQDRLRQVPHPPARQRRHRRSAEGGVLPAGKTKARADQGKEMATDEPVEEPDCFATRRTQPAVPTEPARVQSLPSQRELGEALGLSLRRRDAQLPAQVDGPTEGATADSLRGIGRDLLLKARRLAVTNVDFVAVQQVRKAA